MKKFTSSWLALLAALVSTGALAQVTIPAPTGPAVQSPGSPAARAPGLYVVVLDGLIKVTNPSGTSNFSAGQFGYTASPTQPPAILPKSPGLLFTPPKAFNAAGPVSGSNAAAPKPAAIDCEVR
jgi:hypothetical protein